MLRLLRTLRPRPVTRRRVLLAMMLLLLWTTAIVLVALQHLFPGEFHDGYQQLPPFLFAWLIIWPFVIWLGFRFPLERSRLHISIPVHVLGCALAVCSAQFLGKGSLGRLTHLDHRRGPPPFPWGEGRRGPPKPPPEGFGEFGSPPPPDHRPSEFRRPPPLGRKGPGGPAFGIDLSIFFDAVVYLGTISLCHTIQLFRRSQERERRAIELESNLTQAKLDMLRMQLNPHFLFNTLNAISTLVHTNPHAADNMIGDLSELLRASLNTQGEQEVPLHRELEILQRYLDIEQTRFGNRLRIEKEVEPSLLAALVPTLILQPLVENAIHHGIESNVGQGIVRVQASRSKETLELHISDNGKGLELDASGNQKKTEGRGIGLANTRARLEELYGAKQTFLLANLTEGGCSVVIRIPLREASNPPART